MASSLFWGLAVYVCCRQPSWQAPLLTVSGVEIIPVWMINLVTILAMQVVPQERKPKQVAKFV